jgi:hypothetical protein
LDDVRLIVESAQIASVRMAKILALLNVYQKKQLVPAPVVDAPKALHWHLADASGKEIDAGVVQITGPRSCAADTLAFELENLMKRTEGDACALVVADSKQLQYLESVAKISELSTCGVRIQLKEFLCKERLAPGLPHQALARRAGRAPLENKARSIWDVADAYGVFALVLGLSEACSIARQEIVDRGLRHRCRALLSSFTPSSTVSSSSSSSSTRRHAHDTTKVHGGHVIEPTQSFVDKAMAVVDFKSLYPSIIASENIGADMGIPAVVRDLMKRRANASSVRNAQACKILANSIYGQLASPTSSVYDPKLANQVTASGRRYLGLLVEHLRSAGGCVVYGDTDSCMVTFEGVAAAAECNTLVRKQVALFNDALPEPVHVEVQAVFTRALMLSKKKYIAIADPGEITFIGTLNTRDGLAPVAKRAYADFARLVLCEGVDLMTACIKLREACASIESAPAEDLATVTKLTSLDKGPPFTPPIELARQESMCEDGCSYTAADSIEYVLCKPQGGLISRKFDAVSLHSLGSDRKVESAPLVQLFKNAALSVVRARYGNELVHQIEAALVPSTVTKSVCAFSDE